MAEAPQVDGTSLLSTNDAVDVLLNRGAPVEDTAEAVEETAVEEDYSPDSEAEAEQAEVVAEADDAEAEDIVDDETEAEEEDDEAPDSAEALYRVRVGDEEVEVPLNELTNSYMRQSDYTRKTQQVAEARKAIEAELSTVQGERARYAEQLVAVEQALSQQEPDQEHWNQLYENDPLEYSRQRDLHRDRKEAVAEVQVERQRVHEDHLAHLQAESQKRLEHERERVTELIPEWIDPELASSEKNSVITYAQRVGYSPDELAQVSDARAVAVLRKAMLYDDLMARKPAATKRTAKAPKMAKAGQPTSNKQLSARRRRDALANIGNKSGVGAVDAAIDYLLAK
jgi:hypothetical protein